MAPRRVKVNKFDYKKLSATDVICPICRSILIKPITLPCTHGFCSSCFETTTQNANVVCPLCRVRVGSWLRSATKSKKLINDSLWKAIQDLFPVQVRNKINEIESNHGDKYKETEIKSGKKANVKNVETFNSNIKQSDLCNNSTLKRQPKQSEKMISVSSSTNFVRGNAGQSQNISINTGKNEKRPHILNNFATKEYTCRILCQNVSSKDTQKNIFKESQILIQKKNKRIQEITESEQSNERSNSIESECLYFKPIDYRHNPPSEGLAPIKVPTRKPNPSSHIKILAPSGQNQINMNHLESAFARLCSAVLEEKIEIHKKENIESPAQDTSHSSTKRKHETTQNKTKKKMKSSHISTDNQSLKSKDKNDITLRNGCDTNQCKNLEDLNLSINNQSNAKLKQSTTSLIDEENIKRSLQEQADFELATKLQQTYNQSSKYSTRSTVLKRMAAKNQVRMEGIMTPYKVK